MAAMSDSQGEKLISLIKDLIKVVNVNNGAVSKTSSSDENFTNGKNSDDQRNRIIDDLMKKNSQMIDIKNKIKSSEEKILRLNRKNKDLETQKTKFLQKQVDLEKLQSINTSKYTKAQQDTHAKMLKAAKAEFAIESKKYDEMEKTAKLEKEQQKLRNDAYQNNKKEIDKQIKKENKQAEKKNKRDDEDRLANKLKLAASEAIENSSMSIFNFGKKILNDVLEQDSAMSKLSANYALSRKESGMMKSNLSDAAVTTNMIGVDAGELAKMQASYTDELERSVILSKEGLVSLARMGKATGIGSDGAAKMASEMEIFGYSATSTADLVNELMLKSKKNGMSSSVMTRKLQENLKIANSYTFKDGLKGISEMTLNTSKLRINMQSVAGFADKISNPEGAIQAAASLQVLGGGFAQMSDPLQLMNQGINDLNGLSKTYSKMLDGLAKIDKETGEVVVNGYDRLRIKAASEATGINFDEMMTSIKTKAKRNAIESTLNINPVLKGNEDAKNLIASLSEKKKGVGYTVSISGKDKLVTQLTQDDINALQPKDDSLNLKTVAENTMGLKETWEAGLKSIEQTMLTSLLPIINSVTEYLPKIFKAITDTLGKFFGDSGLLTTVGKVAGGAANGVAAIFKGLGGAISGGGGQASGVLGKAVGGLGKGLPLIGGLLSAIGEYAGTGSGARAVGAGAGSMIGGGLGTLAGGIFGPAAPIAIPLLAAGGGYIGSQLGAMAGGLFDKGNDVLIPSNGKPIMLNKQDDVLAAMPGGALSQAVTPSINAKKTYSGVKPGFSGIYNGGNSKINDSTVNLNINGTITLVGGNNSTKISASELVKDRQFLRELTRIIGNQTNRDKNGGKFAGSLNNNSF